jgi:phospholipase D1/2
MAVRTLLVLQREAPMETAMILQPGRNVWRIVQAARAALLVDAAAYFGAVRRALLKARSRVFIIGWDLHSRGKPDDGYPEYLSDFLSALVRERPQLAVHLLLWDYSVIYATERELFPSWTFGRNTPRQAQLRLDGAVPIGSAHHQKLVVVVDRIAFAGGLDLTERRGTRRPTGSESRTESIRRDGPTVRSTTSAFCSMVRPRERLASSLGRAGFASEASMCRL